jgi:hypothetical protein
MSDPKYKPTNEGIMHEDGYMLPDNEPLMILRGKDIGALNNIVDYIEMLQEQMPQSKTILSHLESSTERLVAFYKYQYENPDLQSVGCSKRSHIDSIFFMKRAKNKIIELNMLHKIKA